MPLADTEESLQEIINGQDAVGLLVTQGAVSVVADGNVAQRDGPCASRSRCEGAYARKSQAEEHCGSADALKTQRSICP